MRLGGVCRFNGRFPWIKKLSWRNALWAVGFVSSTVGINDDVIKRYVALQEKVDTRKVQLDCGF
jgi:REP element-mobilizing transposase RayT